MSIRIRLRRVIKASPAAVWATIEHLETHTEWMADAVSITWRGSQRSGVGAELDCITRVGPFHTHDVLRVTQWRPASVLGIEHRGIVRGSGTFTLHRTLRGRTRFVWEERLRFPLLLGGVVGERLSRPILRHVWKRNLARLAAIVEGRS